MRHYLATDVAIENLDEFEQRLESGVGTGEEQQIVSERRRDNDAAVDEDIAFFSVELDTMPAVREVDTNAVLPPLIR